jgi:hypothetical protein
MRRLLPLPCLAAVAVTLGLAASSSQAAGAQAQADPWLMKSAKLQVQPQRAAEAPVQVDLPRKDWVVLPSSGSMVIILVSKKHDAVVLVERSALAQALAPSDITVLFAQIEADAIKERQPKAADFQSKVLDAGDRRLVAVQYSRPGSLGSERVRQYSVPVGKQLYRLTCISSAAQFAAYDPVFAHIAASFSATD